ncbi:MAG: hypothetical protein Q8L39_04755 [Burkholderiales bacterium]|nr:hypothetical protein [Burkholderiales bacterium]
MYEYRAAMKSYVLNIVYALDLLINALFRGQRHETVSARWGKISGHVRLWYWACRLLNWFDREHCEQAAARHVKIKEATK